MCVVVSGLFHKKGKWLSSPKIEKKRNINEHIKSLSGKKAPTPHILRKHRAC